MKLTRIWDAPAGIAFNQENFPAGSFFVTKGSSVEKLQQVINWDPICAKYGRPVASIHLYSLSDPVGSSYLVEDPANIYLKVEIREIAYAIKGA